MTKPKYKKPSFIESFSLIEFDPSIDPCIDLVIIGKNSLPVVMGAIVRAKSGTAIKVSQGDKTGSILLPELGYQLTNYLPITIQTNGSKTDVRLRLRDTRLLNEPGEALSPAVFSQRYDKERRIRIDKPPFIRSVEIFEIRDAKQTPVHLRITPRDSEEGRLHAFGIRQSDNTVTLRVTQGKNDGSITIRNFPIAIDDCERAYMPPNGSTVNMLLVPRPGEKAWTQLAGPSRV